MADPLVHSSRDGKALCGAAPDLTDLFYAVPLYRGTDKVTCEACLANVEAALPKCPLCGERSLAGVETNYVCDKCWRGASVTFSMMADAEAHEHFGATMNTARMAAAVARKGQEKLTRRERVTRAWQVMQCWVMLLCADAVSGSHGPSMAIRRSVYSSFPPKIRVPLFLRLG